MKANEVPEKIHIQPNAHDRWFEGDIPNGLPKGVFVEYTRTDAFIEKTKEAFCKATCNGYPPRSTCTSLGTCREYDNFVKILREE